MTDDLRETRRRATTASGAPPAVKPPNAIVASARVLSEQRLPIPKPEDWQDETWRYYDTTPEVRFGVGWLQNALGRCRIFAANLSDTGEAPQRIEAPSDEEGGPEDAQEVEALGVTERAALDLMEQFAGGGAAQSRILANAALHLTVPGDGYLVGEPSGATIGEGPDAEDIPAGETWATYSADEISQRSDKRYVVKTGEGANDHRVLAEDALVVRYWRKHGRWSWKADSPMRATLGVLRELALLTAQVEADAVSRLAGAGLLVLPDEITFAVSDKNADAEDPFIAEFIDALTIPISDRSAASAVVPFVIRVKGEWIEKIQHLTFSTPLDDKAQTLREEAIKRFAAGMDLPSEVVLGLADSNHWTAWQIEESAVKLHVEPMLEAICEALTVGYLHPALEALGLDPTGIVVWYDATELTVRPDRSSDAREAYRDGVIGWRAYVREIGMSEEDAPDDEELKRKIILDVITALPSSAPALLPLLGIDVEIDTDAPTLGPAAPTPPQGPQDGDEGPPAPPGPPERQEAPPDAGEAALVASADALVWRALERAGGRLSGAAQRAGANTHGTRADLVHTCLPEEVRLANLDGILAGAWDRCPEIASRYEVDPHALTETLDAYTRALVLAGLPHSFDALAACLGADPLLVPGTYDEEAPAA